MPSSANEATINSPTRATSSYVWDSAETTDRRRNDVEIERTFFWTDSTAVLQRLHGADKKQPLFVANRVA